MEFRVDRPGDRLIDLACSRIGRAAGEDVNRSRLGHQLPDDIDGVAAPQGQVAAVLLQRMR